MKRLFAVLVFLVLVSALVSCEKGKDAALFTGDADFSLTLKRGDGEGTLTMDATRRGGVTEARITSPAELSGVKFSRGGDGSVIFTGSVSVPLTEDAARGANIVFDVLSDPVPENASVEKTEEGAVWTFERDGCSVILRIDRYGIPQGAEITADGMKRTARIDSFVKR